MKKVITGLLILIVLVNCKTNKDKSSIDYFLDLAKRNTTYFKKVNSHLFRYDVYSKTPIYDTSTFDFFHTHTNRFRLKYDGGTIDLAYNDWYLQSLRFLDGKLYQYEGFHGVNSFGIDGNDNRGLFWVVNEFDSLVYVDANPPIPLAGNRFVFNKAKGIYDSLEFGVPDVYYDSILVYVDDMPIKTRRHSYNFLIKIARVPFTGQNEVKVKCETYCQGRKRVFTKKFEDVRITDSVTLKKPYRR